MKQFHRKLSLKLAVLGLLGSTGGLIAGAFSPANAALSNTSMVMSNNQVGSTATYTAVFSTGTALVGDLLVALPSGVTGLSTSNTSVFTSSSCTGTFSPASLSGPAVLNGDNIGLPINISSLGTCVKVVMTGLTNPSTPGTANACEADALAVTLGLNLTATNLGNLVCGSGGLTGGLLPGLLADVTSINLSYVTQAVNGISTALNVAPALTTSLDNTYQSFGITPAPTGVEASNATQALSVATNAQNYTVEGLVSGGSSALTWVGPTSHSIPFGYTAGTGSGNSPASCSGSGTPFGSNGTYTSVQNALSGLTNGQTTNLNYCWNVDYTDPAGLYQATVTYLVVPTF